MTIPQEPPSHINTPLVLGPLVIAILLNTGVYGICVAQFNNYWESKAKDRAIIKYIVFPRCPIYYSLDGLRFLVWWTFILDSFHTASLIYMLWIYVVVEFENVEFLQQVLWPFSATPAVTSLSVWSIFSQQALSSRFTAPLSPSKSISPGESGYYRNQHGYLRPSLSYQLSRHHLGLPALSLHLKCPSECSLSS